MAAILNSPILDSAILVFPLKPTHICQDWFPLFAEKNFTHTSLPNLESDFNLIQSDSNSFNLTQLDDDSHLEFCHLGFSHFAQKKTSLIHSDLTWWWQSSWILPFWIQTLPSWIQTPGYHLSDSLKNILPPLWLWLTLIQSDSNSFILTQLDDGGHLEFCHLGFSFWHLGFRHLVIFSQNHSKTLSLHSDSDSN